MSFVNTDSPAAVQQPGPEELPPGWRHTDDLEWVDLEGQERRRRRLLILGLAGIAVVALLVVAGLFVVDANSHYSRGVAALESGEYARAQAELSQAAILGVSYRDASVLAEQARRELTAQAAGAEAAAALAEDVGAALAEAAGALKEQSAPQVLVALGSVRAADLQLVLREDESAAQAAASLAKDLTTEGRKALARLEWGRAGRYAAALLVLKPSSAAAAEITAEAEAGERLSAKIAEAKEAARAGEWRKALRLALAVQAARKDFPGAASLVADARKALKPKPTPQPAAAATVTTPATTSGGTSTGGGSSSGGSSQPPPP
jgi:hypothetical protein